MHARTLIPPSPPSQVELVKKRCLPGHDGLNLPMLEEYDFRNDRNTPNLNVRALRHVAFSHDACSGAGRIDVPWLH